MENILETRAEVTAMEAKRKENKSYSDGPMEKRYISEIRANTETRIISGTAIVFGKESSDLGGFREVIQPADLRSFDEFLKTQNIMMLYNHSTDSGVLARYTPTAERNSLHFEVGEGGVNFDFRAKKKDDWLIDSINDGDLTNCSFSFRCADGGETWEKRSNDYIRTITEFTKIGDFSIVPIAAYEDTSVNVRGLETLKSSLELEAQLEKENEIRKAKEWQEYYEGICKTYLKK